MGTLIIFIGVLYWMCKVIKENCGGGYDSDVFGTSGKATRRFQEDSMKVSFGEMSSKEMGRRARAGYYKDIPSEKK